MNSDGGSVAVVGSINIDVVIELRQSPSAGETVLATGLSDAVGGKGFNRVRFVLNPSPMRDLDAGLLAAADPLVVNRGEAQQIVRGAGGVATGSGPAENEPEELLRELSTMCRSAVLTAGAGGAYVFDGCGFHHVAGLEVKTHDTTGAGDEFLGTVVAALAAGSELLPAVELGNEAAAAIVQLSRSARL
jgi:ribokinase